MNYQRLENGAFVPVNFEDLINGDRIKKEVVSGVWQECNFTVEQKDDVFSIDSVETTINGNPPASYSPIYFVDNGDAITMTANIIDDNNDVQSQLDQTALGYPPVLALPLTKYAGGSSGTIIDEVYFETTLTNGVISATGTLPSAGNWKLETHRINKSLKAIGSDWGIDSLSVDFIVR